MTQLIRALGSFSHLRILPSLGQKTMGPEGNNHSLGQAGKS